MASLPRISIVIPARNEEAYLPRLLDSVDVARRAHPAGEAAIEVIVADNVSTDATAAIAASRGCRVVGVEKRVIGAVRNAGALSASGEVLVFVDADARVHPGTFAGIDAALATSRFVGGATGVRLERMSLGIAVTYALLVPFVWLTRMDTGPTFCRRADFEAIGGYSETMLFGEDVKLLVDLRRLGKPRRQRLVRLTSYKAVASTRKFDRYGDWHYLRMLVRLGPKLLLRRADEVDAFAHDYWYADRR